MRPSACRSLDGDCVALALAQHNEGVCRAAMPWFVVATDPARDQLQRREQTASCDGNSAGCIWHACGWRAAIGLPGRCLLFVATWIVPLGLQGEVGALLTLSFLGLHGAVGHAAVDGVFSLAEALQWVHLLDMALWSGGCAGLGAARRAGIRGSRGPQAEEVRGIWDVSRRSAHGALPWFFCREPSKGTGPREESRCSVPATGTRSSAEDPRGDAHGGVLARATGGCLGGPRHGITPWCGARRGRCALNPVCMAIVLLLSAWLANSPLPME